jgi:hypothetical protein
MAHAHADTMRDHTVWRAALTAHRRRLRFVRDPESYAQMLREAGPDDVTGHRLNGAPLGVAGAAVVRGRACNAYFVFTAPGVHHLSGDTVVRAMLLGDPRAVPCAGGAEGAEGRLSPQRAVNAVKKRHHRARSWSRSRSRTPSPSEFERIPYPYQIVADDDWRGGRDTADPRAP